MPILKGLITGTLGYEKKKEFFGNALMYREVDLFNYEIYSTDFETQNADVIQNKIKSEFSNVYSGDVRVLVFNTQNTYQFPSDSLRASKFAVSVEIKRLYTNLSTDFPELATDYYKGIDSSFFNSASTSYAQYLLDFKEDFSFSTNSNGNREFGHNFSFGLQTGWSQSIWAGNQSDALVRRGFAQKIATGIFDKDKETTFGIATMVGEVLAIADKTIFRNYYNESYDLMKNTYSFSRKREELPFTSGNLLTNLNHTINLNPDGTIEVSEKASTFSKLDFSIARDSLESFYSQAFARCSGLYHSFYTNDNIPAPNGIILQDAQYINKIDHTTNPPNIGFLSLINNPIKLTKFYDSNSLQANYDVTYSNNPNYFFKDGYDVSISGIMASEILEFNVDKYNIVEANHSFEFTSNRITNDVYAFNRLISGANKNSATTMGLYYTGNFKPVANIFPNFNLIKSASNISNIKPKASLKLEYSNNPTYFVTKDNVKFRILDYTIDKKFAPDIIHEYKVINRPQKQSIMTYEYQSEKGEVSINIKASIGKQYSQFSTDSSNGGFDKIVYDETQKLKIKDYLTPIYKFAGQLFLSQFGTPNVAFNWYISDSKYSFNSDGELTVQLNYAFTIKKREGTDHMNGVSAPMPNLNGQSIFGRQL